MVNDSTGESVPKWHRVQRECSSSKRAWHDHCYARKPHRVFDGEYDSSRRCYGTSTGNFAPRGTGKLTRGQRLGADKNKRETRKCQPTLSWLTLPGGSTVSNARKTLIRPRGGGEPR